jgi:hypothetical protein
MLLSNFLLLSRPIFSSGVSVIRPCWSSRTATWETGSRHHAISNKYGSHYEPQIAFFRNDGGGVTLTAQIGPNALQDGFPLPITAHIWFEIDNLQ